MSTTTLTIGQVAKRAGIGVETVRYYERQGLLEKPSRRASGYRQYEPRVVDRLGFIRQAKDLGFTLREIKQLLELRLDPSSNCADVKQRADAKVDQIDAKIDTLQRMRRALVKLTKACNGKGTTEDCPILEALEQREQTR